MTIYTTETAATALIAQPGRAVTTFPSGLVRVDQNYLGLTSQATAHRAILAVGNNLPDGDNSPAQLWEISEGTNFETSLKIFPEAQESRRVDGFSQYVVSAYGRRSDGISRRGLSVEKFQKTFTQQQSDDSTITWTITEFWELETITDYTTLKSTDSIADLVAPESSLLQRLRLRTVSGTPPSANVTLLIGWSISILSLNRINYGHIDEVTTTWGYTGNV